MLISSSSSSSANGPTPGGVAPVRAGHGGQALRRVSFEFHAPTYPDEGMADEADVDSDAEIHSVGEERWRWRLAGFREFYA